MEPNYNIPWRYRNQLQACVESCVATERNMQVMQDNIQNIQNMITTDTELSNITGNLDSSGNVCININNVDYDTAGDGVVNNIIYVWLSNSFSHNEYYTSVLTYLSATPYTKQNTMSFTFTNNGWVDLTTHIDYSNASGVIKIGRYVISDYVDINTIMQYKIGNLDSHTQCIMFVKLINPKSRNDINWKYAILPICVNYDDASGQYRTNNNLDCVFSLIMPYENTPTTKLRYTIGSGSTLMALNRTVKELQDVVSKLYKGAKTANWPGF